jgi:hypothetical protein
MIGSRRHWSGELWGNASLFLGYSGSRPFGHGGGVRGLSAAMAGTAVLVAGIGSDDSP